MKKLGVLSVISGFSGVGKGTIVKKLVAEEDYALSISATSRAPREGEVHGREYFFLTRDEFHSMIESDGLIEWAEYVNNFYGTPREYVEERLAEGKDVILEIEPQGALKIKEKYPKRAAEETEYIDNYEYIVVNDNLDDAVRDIHHIIQAASHKKDRAEGFIEALTDDLKKSF